MDFQEADRRYVELRQEHKAGTITDEEFEAQLKQLMVQDPYGRWWAKSRKTGEWYYNDGTGWVRGTPQNDWVELARIELAPVGRQAGIATGLLVTGVMFLLLFLITLSLAGVYILDVFLSLWVAALIVSGILLLIGGILARVGANMLRKLDPKPHRTIRFLQQNVNGRKATF